MNIETSTNQDSLKGHQLSQDQEEGKEHEGGGVVVSPQDADRVMDNIEGRDNAIVEQRGGDDNPVAAGQKAA